MLIAKRECMEVQNMKNSKYQEYFAPTVVLVAICLVITFALAYVNSITSPIIEENAIKKANETRKVLLPEADNFSEFTGELAVLEEGKVFIKDCFVADNGAGIVVTVKTKSFGGLLTEMVGINGEGAITGVKVTNHADTPGLGTKAHLEGHLDQYKGLTELTATNAKSDPAVDHVSGATISSNGVHYGVYAALEQFKIVGGAK